MKKILGFILSCLTFSASAMVLDWSGSYEAEMFFLQQGQDSWKAGTTHNLRLKPDIKVFDGLRVRSWFQLSSLSSGKDVSKLKFYPQAGPKFRSSEGDSLPVSLEVRDLYMEWSHSFGLLQFGWKPHHFGAGMYYNESSDLFDPVYNLEGSRGMISWKGILGSYYIQPMVHYVDSLFFNAFIQGGWTKEKYGVEGIYKRAGVGLSDSKDTQEQDYIGLYAYLKMGSFNVALEGGNSVGSYGAALDLDWQSPWKKLAVGLDVALSTSSDQDAFYFDPTFSSGTFLVIGLYEGFKTDAEYLKEYGGYSFHNAMLVKPSVAFSLSKSIILEGAFLAQASYSDMSAFTYGAEAIFAYKLDKGLEWNTGVSVAFPVNDNFQIGVCTQVAIIF